MSAENEIIVHVRHVRQAKLCMKGSRAWMNMKGLDWNDFVINGISVGRLRAEGDSILESVIRAALSE